MHTENAKRPKLTRKVSRGQVAVRKPCCDVWTESFIAESAHRVADAAFILIEEAVEVQQLERVRCRSAARTRCRRCRHV